MNGCRRMCIAAASAACAPLDPDAGVPAPGWARSWTTCVAGISICLQGGASPALLNADHAGKSDVLVNLASRNARSVKRSQLDVPVIRPVFRRLKGGRCKIISFFAKRARGLMAALRRRAPAEGCRKLKQFDSEEYAFVPEALG